jgi:NADH-quinone oxidoreductase chain G|tara:strand:+ start:8946 stop:11033 length:2088 start_codon:yes stop_codon:yes gene_type:complete
MIKVTVDGTNVFVKRGSTVLQACEAVGIEIPRFCYHERLSVAGNCRMCLVEIEKTPKPVASCAMPTMDGMKVFTNTPLVKKAREAVLEFLLLNHPLDCPICDQGGECDLQDQAMLFGSDRSRFYETKRGVEDKNCGPLIKTIMTRCIHCTRCVRFATEIAGVEELGTTGRGIDTEIGTYVEKTFNSELSGNIIDLCPVGALTSKPYAFMSRPWELRSTNSIDISDGIGSNIRIDSRGTEVLRILPRFNESINEEWISDKARFSYDGLRLQRIESPYIRKNGQLVPAHWAEAFDIIAQQLYKSLSNTSTKPRILGLVSESIDLESAWVLKRWFQLLGANFDLKTALDNEIKCNLQVNYLQNTSIASIEESDLCLLIGVDPRYEASLLNVRLRKRYLEGGFTVASVGSPLNLTFPCQQLGLGKKTFIDVCEGYHPFSKQLAMAQKPIVIIGSTLFSSKTDNSLAYNLVNVLKSNVPALVNSDWNGLNFLNLEVNSVGIFDLGISEENSNNQYDIAFLLASDLSSTKLSKDTFVIYQGSHGDISANIADVVLPGATFVEKSNIFTNVEGHSQIANKVISPPGLAREDWKVLTELIRFLIRTCLVNKKVVSKGRQKLSNTDKIIKLVPSIASCYNTNYYYRNESHTFLETKLGQTKFNNSEKLPFNKSVHNFYITSNITRASVTMVKCSSIYNNKDNFI